MKALSGGCIIACFFCICGTGSTDDLERIPPVHAMDDFNECKAKGDIFCRIQFTLSPNTYNNKAWQIIQATKRKPDCFNRDVVYRFRCFSKHLDKNIAQIKGNATENENKLLQNYSLNAKVDEIECATYSEKITITSYDYALLYSTMSWLAFIVLVTFYDVLGRIIPNWRAPQFMKSLSLLSNWEDLRKPIRNKDYQKLISIQGLRTMNVAIVVAGHSVYTAVFAFVADTDFIEDFYRNGFKKFIMNMGLHIVQTNFLISGWILANQLHSYLEKHKRLSVRFSLNMILYRYLRASKIRTHQWRDERELYKARKDFILNH